MKLIKHFSLFIFLSFSMVVLSQNDIDVKKIQFQVRGGLNVSTLRVNIDGKAHSEKSKIGYNFGGIADISLGKSFYFQPGLSLTAKGSKLREMPLDNGNTMDLSMNALYLQVPVYFAYKMPVGNWPNFMNVAMGPYFAYGVGGKITGKDIHDIDTFGEGGLANRPDVGLGIEVHFEMPKVVFFYGAEIGFATILKREYFDKNIRNSNLYLGMGYKF